MDALATQCLAELLLQQVIDAVKDEIHHLDWGVNDAQALGHLGKGVAEEFVVKLDDDLLFSLGIVDAGSTLTHAGVELL
ncbi:hypothetical protein D3C81_2164430 [compost metagenome]